MGAAAVVEQEEEEGEGLPTVPRSIATVGKARPQGSGLLLLHRLKLTSSFDHLHAVAVLSAVSLRAPAADHNPSRVRIRMRTRQTRRKVTASTKLITRGGRRPKDI